MTSILLIGNGPLPYKNQIQAHNAASLRTAFFKKMLEEDGLKVTTVLIDPNNASDHPEMENGAYLFNKNEAGLLRKIESILRSSKSKAMVAANTYPSFVASQLKTDLPLWADLNGWVMAEAQSQAGVIKSDALLAHYFSLEQAILRRADRISTVSTPQKYAVIGELATLGRLNQYTNQEALVHVIANHFEVLLPTPPRQRQDEKEFKVFFCGGYNTWVDEETLFKGLEYAMKKNSSIRFVSTGGVIAGLDDSTYGRFRIRIEASNFKDRFEFLGWVEFQAVPQLFADADVGINVDLSNYESEFGARNRLNEMLVRQLPIITSLNSEISHDLDKAKAALTFKSGDFEAFGEAILTLKNDSQLARALVKNGDNLLRTIYDPKHLTEALRQWCKRPERASDAGKIPSVHRQNLFKALHYSLKKDGLKKTWQRVWKKLRG